MQMVKCEWQHVVPIVSHSTGQYYWSRDQDAKNRWSFKTTLTQILLPSQSHIFREGGNDDLSLLVRLLAIYCSVFCQWYQRPILNHCRISDHLFSPHLFTITSANWSSKSPLYPKHQGLMFTTIAAEISILDNEIKDTEYTIDEMAHSK